MHSIILLGFWFICSCILEGAVHTAGHVLERRAIVLQDHEERDYACWKHGKGEGLHSEKSQPVSQCIQTVTRDVDDCSKYSVCLMGAYGVAQIHTCACGDGQKFNVGKQQCAPQNQVTDCSEIRKEYNSARRFYHLKDLISLPKSAHKTVGVKDEKLEHLCQYVGKFPLETSCDGYVQCELGAGAKLEAFKYECPEGKEYSKNYRICMHPAFARCPFSKYREQKLSSTGMPVSTTRKSAMVTTTPGNILKSITKHYKPSSTIPSTLVLPSTIVTEVTPRPYVLTSATTHDVVSTRKPSTKLQPTVATTAPRKIFQSTTKHYKPSSTMPPALVLPSTTVTRPTSRPYVLTSATTNIVVSTRKPSTMPKPTVVMTTRGNIFESSTKRHELSSTMPSALALPSTVATQVTSRPYVLTSATTHIVVTTRKPSTAPKMTTTTPKVHVYSVKNKVVPASVINEPVRMQKVIRLETEQVKQKSHSAATSSTRRLPPMIPESYSSSQALPSHSFSSKENVADSTSRPQLSTSTKYSRPTKENPTYEEEIPEYREDTLEYVDKGHDYDSYRAEPVYSQERVDYSFEEAPVFEEIMEEMEEASQDELLFPIDNKDRKAPTYDSLAVPPPHVDQKTPTYESDARPVYADTKDPAYKSDMLPYFVHNEAPAYAEKVPVHLEIQEPTYSSKSPPIYEKSNPPIHSELQPPKDKILLEPAYNSSKGSVNASSSVIHFANPLESPVHAERNATTYEDPDPPTYNELQDKAPMYNRNHFDYTLEPEPEVDTGEDIDYVREDPPEYYHEDAPDYSLSSASSHEEAGLSGEHEIHGSQPSLPNTRPL